MIYLDLFLGFLRVGCFSFGGAYSAIPLIRDVVASHGWMADDMLADMIAVSESTPGPIMVNLATYIGSSQGGILGALIATVAVVLPAFLIILLVTALLKTLLKDRYVAALLKGLEPGIIGIILATGLYMTAGNIFPKGTGFDARAAILLVVLAGGFFGAKYGLKKKFSPILLIVIAAVGGVLMYGL